MFGANANELLNSIPNSLFTGNTYNTYLNDNGQLVIIGPGKSNAIELDKLNKDLDEDDEEDQDQGERMTTRIKSMIAAPLILQNKKGR